MLWQSSQKPASRKAVAQPLQGRGHRFDPFRGAARPLPSPALLSSSPPRIDDRPEPKSEQDHRRDGQRGSGVNEGQGLGRHSPAYQPTENPRYDHRQPALDVLAVVELTQAGEDPRKDQGNRLSAS